MIGNSRGRILGIPQARARAPLKPHTLYVDQPHMLRKTLRKELVCWMHKVPRGAIADAKIIRPGAEVAIRENENPSLNGRMPLAINGEILFCDRKQFWDSVKER